MLHSETDVCIVEACLGERKRIMSTELEGLHQRLKDVIVNTCNTVGCKDCILKWGNGECSATSLQNKIMELEVYGEHN